MMAAVMVNPTATVMKGKAAPHVSARRSPKAPCAHSAEVASAEVASHSAGVAATAEAARVAAPSEPAASVAAPAHPAAPCEAAASVAAAPASSAASTGVRSCCNGASGERASEQNDHHLFQHICFSFLGRRFRRQRLRNW
jgi:hypothetical protein